MNPPIEEGPIASLGKITLFSDFLLTNLCF